MDRIAQVFMAFMVWRKGAVCSVLMMNGHCCQLFEVLSGRLLLNYNDKATTPTI